MYGFKYGKNKQTTVEANRSSSASRVFGGNSESTQTLVCQRLAISSAPDMKSEFKVHVDVNRCTTANI